MICNDEKVPRLLKVSEAAPRYRKSTNAMYLYFERNCRPSKKRREPGHVQELECDLPFGDKAVRMGGCWLIRIADVVD